MTGRGHRRRGADPGRAAQGRPVRRPPGRSVGARADARWPSGSGSTRPTSTTSSGAASPRSASSRGTSAAAPCSRPAGPSRCPAPRSTGSAAPASRRSISPRPPCSSGQADLVVAGGVESMSRVPMGSSIGRRQRVRAVGAGPLPRRGEGFAADDPVPFNQGVGAEMIAARWGFSRARLDEYALASHAKAAAAQDAGLFDAEIAPVRPATAARSPDEGVRRDTTLAKLGGLQDAVPAGRRGHRRLRVADLRRRGRAGGHHVASGPPRTACGRWPASTPPWSPPTTR